jgi:hypothetical protein
MSGFIKGRLFASLRTRLDPQFGKIASSWQQLISKKGNILLLGLD